MQGPHILGSHDSLSSVLANWPILSGLICLSRHTFLDPSNTRAQSHFSALQYGWIPVVLLLESAPGHTPLRHGVSVPCVGLCVSESLPSYQPLYYCGSLARAGCQTNLRCATECNESLPLARITDPLPNSGNGVGVTVGRLWNEHLPAGSCTGGMNTAGWPRPQRERDVLMCADASLRTDTVPLLVCRWQKWLRGPETLAGAGRARAGRGHSGTVHVPTHWVSK